MWDLRSSRLQWARPISDLHSITRSDLAATAIDFSLNGEKLLVRRDSELQYCDAATGRILATQRHPRFVGDAGIRPNGGNILAGVIDAVAGQVPFKVQLKQWRPGSREDDFKTLTSTSAPTTLKFSHSTSLLAMLKQDDNIRLYDTGTGDLLWTGSLAAGGEYFPLGIFSRDDQYLATYRSRGPIQIWEVRTGKLLRSYVASYPYNDNDVFAFSSSGKLAAICNVPAQVEVKDIASGKTLRTFDEKNIIIRSLQFSPDDSVLAIGTNKGVWLWRQ
jgi:WD40 repeat protein